MGMTIIEKILAKASGKTSARPGDLVVVDVDTVVLYDGNFFPAYWREIHHVANPENVVVAFDHRVPAPDQFCAKAHAVGRDFVKKFNIERFHDVGPRQGICHVVVAENAYALPGSVLICSDSHAGSAGALNCAARGTGGPDVIYALTKGTTWYRICETIRYDFVGTLQHGVTPKDVFLHICSAYGDHSNYNVEYGGPGLASLSVDERRTLATMGTELNAEFTIFEADEVLERYIKARTDKLFTPFNPDPDAAYADRRTIDLSLIQPQIAFPDKVINNAFPIGEALGKPIHQAFIGSCANGNLYDLAIAAEVVVGRSVAPGVKFIVTPGSQAVYLQALEAGYIETLLRAGAVVTSATCGACQGGHMGVLGPGETCITASTRNFKGRMGDPSARIYMASPATVAASAVAGVVAHPGDYLSIGEAA
ncbi:aconitase/3-isopropylmalate dehydratase large subunit family protein [Sinorhizobium meliloti]|uniref:3-isopropylmalate dehydratase n=1 Tax=Rhizobium meliloti TaxID=382 RepID=A0A2J0YYW9_RHIML|nr:aconitase/3-isopropylmalate dehydratase large subunit family protein [Sinorhizobium meliloti]PJR13437.1 3-isopropylmalate dehydratase [Sinorhizobium meliloti]